MLQPDFSDRIKLVYRWLSDVTDVVDALFNAGLVTVFFGDSSVVSNTVWDLQQTKLKMSQQWLSELWTSNSSFAGGCYQLDVASGLKIQSLPMTKRMQILIKVTGMSRLDQNSTFSKQQYLFTKVKLSKDETVKICIADMKPAIAEFQERFGSKGLGSSDARYLEFLKAICIWRLGAKICFALF